MNYMYILDYSTGTVYMHLLTTKELDSNGDEVFERLCEENDIRANDSYYMITSDNEIITI